MNERNGRTDGKYPHSTGLRPLQEPLPINKDCHSGVFYNHCKYLWMKKKQMGYDPSALVGKTFKPTKKIFRSILLLICLSVCLLVCLSVSLLVCLSASRLLFSLLNQRCIPSALITPLSLFYFFYLKFMKWLQFFLAPTANLGRTPEKLFSGSRLYFMRYIH